MECNQCIELLRDVERKMDPHLPADLRNHLDTCPHCKSELLWYQSQREIWQELNTTEIPVNLHQNIMLKIRDIQEETETVSESGLHSFLDKVHAWFQTLRWKQGLAVATASLLIVLTVATQLPKRNPAQTVENLSLSEDTTLRHDGPQMNKAIEPPTMMMTAPVTGAVSEEPIFIELEMTTEQWQEWVTYFTEKEVPWTTEGEEDNPIYIVEGTGKVIVEYYKEVLIPENAFLLQEEVEPEDKIPEQSQVLQASQKYRLSIRLQPSEP